MEHVEAWKYLLGERRVRGAPALQFDMPNSLSAARPMGRSIYLLGQLVECDFNDLRIKKPISLYMNKFTAAPVAQQYLQNFIDPDLSRWELNIKMRAAGTAPRTIRWFLAITVRYRRYDFVGHANVLDVRLRREIEAAETQLFLESTRQLFGVRGVGQEFQGVQVARHVVLKVHLGTEIDAGDVGIAFRFPAENCSGVVQRGEYRISARTV